MPPNCSYKSLRWQSKTEGTNQFLKIKKNFLNRKKATSNWKKNYTSYVAKQQAVIFYINEKHNTGK